jgi:hypothetical protein
VPGPPSSNENYVICISFPGPLSERQLRQLNTAIKKCAKKLSADAKVLEQKVAPKR